MFIQLFWLVIAFPWPGCWLTAARPAVGTPLRECGGTGGVALAFAAGALSLMELLARPPPTGRWPCRCGLDYHRQLSSGDEPAGRPAVTADGAGRDRRGLSHPRLTRRLHGARGRPVYARFFTFLNLFIVSCHPGAGRHYLLMYVLGVVARSYLLIGFWFHKQDEPQAPIILKDGEAVPVRPT